MTRFCYVYDSVDPCVWYGCGASREEAYQDTISILEENNEEYAIEGGSILFGDDIVPCYEMTEEAYEQLKEGSFDDLCIKDCKVYVGLGEYGFKVLSKNKIVGIYKGDIFETAKVRTFLGGFAIAGLHFFDSKLEKKGNAIIIDDRYTVYIFDEEILLESEEDVLCAFAESKLLENAEYIDDLGNIWEGLELKEAIHDGAADYDAFIGTYYRIA